MKGNPLLYLWMVLSEVPGWPDAPRVLRLRRTLPAVLPCVVALGLFAWHTLLHEPAHQTVRQAHDHLLLLESEVSSLRLACSEQQAAELATRMAETDGMLLAGPDEAPGALDALAAAIAAHGWQATFHIYDTGNQPNLEGATLGSIPVLVRLHPVESNAQPFPTLLASLEALAPEKRRFEITRLAVQTDERESIVAEANLRLSHRLRP